MKNSIRIFVFLITLYISSAISAQINPSIEWQKSFGGSSGETSNSILETADGGFVTAGYSWSMNGDVTGNHGLSDYWIVKLDAGGNLLWQKTYGGTDNDVAWAMKQTTDGGFIIAGYSRSSDGDIPINKGLTDYCIMKLDASGNLTWEKTFGGSNDDWAYAVQQTNDLGFIVAGYSKSSDGDVTLNHGDWDYWILKLDSTGNLIWQKSLGGSDADEAYVVAETSDGGFVVAGGSDSNDGDASGNHGDGDNWIVKLNGSGEIIWQKSFGGSGDDYAYALEQTADGGFIVAGSSTSNDDDVSGNYGGTDYSVMKLDADGNLQWEKYFGGSNYDVANAVKQTADGGYIVAGYSFSSDHDVTENFGLDDYWIVKLDSTGNLLWQESIGGSGYDQANAIQQSADGGFIIAGLSFSNDHDVTGNHTNSLGNTEDYWIVKLSSDTESGIASVYRDSISVYPDPAINFLMINSSIPAVQAIVSVFNMNGQKVFLPVTISGNTIKLNTTYLPSGLYTLIITDNETGMSEAKKFVRQK